MLKQRAMEDEYNDGVAATFGWLCVETDMPIRAMIKKLKAATFGWLCVETTISRCNKLHTNRQPPSGGCVLKRPHSKLHKRHTPAATFGWLCVETCGQIRNLAALMCSHLRVAVC